MAKDTDIQITDEGSQQSEITFLTRIHLFLRRIGAYITAAFIDYRRSPLTMFFSVAYPIILILLFGAIFSESNSSFSAFTVYVQSEGDEGYAISPVQTLNFTDDLINTLQTMKTNDSESLFDVHFIPLKNAQNDAINPGEYLEEVQGYISLVIPFNFTQEVLFNSDMTTLQIILDENSQSASIAYSIISNVIYRFNLGVSGYNETNIGLDTFDIYLEEEIAYFEFLIPAMICVALMNNGVMGTINRYSFFRKQGFFKKLSASPMKKADVVIGETSWQLVQGVLSIVAILLVGWLVFKVPSGDFGWIIRILDWKIILVVISAVMSFVGLGMIGSRLSKNPDAATALGNFLTFPMMFLSGAFFDVSGVPGVNIVSKMLPLTYLIDALRASMITGNVSIAWTNIGISFAFGTTLMIIGILITKLTDE
ncbi:MAG: ABC transporter permease [Candidatus Heimdallarchaeaceae archaeon]